VQFAQNSKSKSHVLTESTVLPAHPPHDAAGPYTQQMTKRDLNLPTFDARLRRESGRMMIFDILRKKYVALTPEEHVRQHFVHYLCEQMGYPQSVMANEVMLMAGQKRLRCDTVVYDPTAHPRMIVEYKAPTLSVTQEVFDQISVYNLLLKVDYLIVSNGLSHYCCKMDYEHQNYLFLEHIPTYELFLQTISEQNKQKTV